MSACSGIAFSQVVQSVSFEINEKNNLVVDYSLSYQNPELVFDVSLFMSSDGGSSFFQAKSVLGDLSAVSGSGPKRITWDVFADVDVFVGKACIAKVVAKEIHTIGEVVRNMLFGSDETKEFVNSAFIHVGWQKVTFQNSVFKSDGGFEIGFRYISLPVMIEVDGFLQRFSSSGGLEVGHTGINSSASFCLAISKYVTPAAGLGYQASALYIGSSYGTEATSQVATNGVFYTVSAQINLSEVFKVGYEYKSSIGLGSKQWNQLMAFIGFNWPGLTKMN